MKLLLFIFVFLISLVCQAGNYMAKSEISDCERGNRVSFLNKDKCELTKGEQCDKLPSDYLCNTFSYLDTEVDDITKPIYSKSEIDTCLDEEDCQLKLEAKICTDQEEYAIKNLDLMEVYCSKFLGYQQKTVKKWREDPAKKAIKDAEDSQKEVEKQLRIDEINEIKLMLTDIDASTLPEWHKKLLKRLVKELKE